MPGSRLGWDLIQTVMSEWGEKVLPSRDWKLMPWASGVRRDVRMVVLISQLSRRLEGRIRLTLLCSGIVAGHGRRMNHVPGA